MPGFRETELLQKVVEVTTENNKLLVKMHKAQVWANVMRVIYWVVIIALILGSFVFIRPFLEPVLSLYGGLLGGADTLKNLGSGDISDVLGQLGI